MKSIIIFIFLFLSCLAQSHEVKTDLSYNCKFRKLDVNHALVAEVASMRIKPADSITGGGVGGVIGTDNGVQANVGSYLLFDPSEDSLHIKGRQKVFVTIHSDEIYQEFGVSIDGHHTIKRIPLDTFTNGYLYRVECLLEE